MAAGRDESEQVKEVHGDGRDVGHGSGVVEDDPGLKDVGRSPADEELENDDEQHPDDALLRNDETFGTGLTETGSQ